MIRGVHAGRKALSPEASYEIAEHATDDVLMPAEISVVRSIAPGNANKQIADQLCSPRRLSRVESSQSLRSWALTIERTPL
jgi:DNA-binding NarL/FixJ family response regulator